MPFKIVQNDIIKMNVDAIVNATNIELKQGGGVCGAIFKAAGAQKLSEACDKLAPIKVGEAVITPGFNLLAKHVIHAAGPIYQSGKYGEEELLRDAYRNALKLAVENGCESIAFPLISSGIYGYPKAEALAVATSEIQNFLLQYDMYVFLVVLDKEMFAISHELLGDVESYLDEHYVDEDQIIRESSFDLYDLDAPAFLRNRKIESDKTREELDHLIENLDETFSATLIRLIDAKGHKTDAEVYKRANIDRRLFSKMRNDEYYKPSKTTAIALAIALCLSLDETKDLLERAGFALSPSHKFDIIIEYFISNGKYDIFEINNVLFHYDQPLLGGWNGNEIE